MNPVLLLEVFTINTSTTLDRALLSESNVDAAVVSNEQAESNVSSSS